MSKSASAKKLPAYVSAKESAKILEVTLKSLRLDRLAAERAQRFVLFCMTRIEQYGVEKVQTVHFSIHRHLMKIKQREERDGVRELLFDRIERACLGLDKDGAPVARPPAIKKLDEFLEKNGLVRHTQTAVERFGKELPLLEMFLLLFASCKLNDELEDATSKLVATISQLPDFINAQEKNQLKTESKNAKKYGRTVINGVDLSKMTPLERAKWRKEYLDTLTPMEKTAYLIENGEEDKVRKKAPTEEANAENKTATEGAEQEAKEESESTEDDEDEDDDDETDEDDEDGDGDDDDDDDDDDDEDEDDEDDDGEGKEEDDDGEEKVDATTEQLNIAEGIVTTFLNDLIMLMMKYDDIYQSDIQKKGAALMKKEKSESTPSKQKQKRPANGQFAEPDAKRRVAESGEAHNGTADEDDEDNDDDDNDGDDDFENNDDDDNDVDDKKPQQAEASTKSAMVVE